MEHLLHRLYGVDAPAPLHAQRFCNDYSMHEHHRQCMLQQSVFPYKWRKALKLKKIKNVKQCGKNKNV